MRFEDVHYFLGAVTADRCRACKRTFTALGGTPLSCLRHRAKWLDYLDKMLETRSVRASADAVGCSAEYGRKNALLVCDVKGIVLQILCS